MNPEEVEIGGLALAFTGLIVCAVAYALCSMGQQFGSAILGAISHYVKKILFIGGLLGRGIDWIDKQWNNAFSPLVSGLESNLGWYWSELGNLFASLGEQILGLSAAFDGLVAYLYGVVKPFVIHTVLDGLKHGAKWLRAELAHIKHTVYHVTQVLEHPLSGPIASGVRAGTRVITAKVASAQRWITHTGRWLYHEVAVELPHDIAGLRARDLSLSRLYARLHKILTKDLARWAALPFALAVAVALGRLGAGWVRCSNWGRLGRGVCRMPGHFLDDLLGLLTDFLVITNICQVLPWLETAASDVAGPVIGTLSRAGAGVCAGSSGPAGQLHPPALYLAGTGGTPTLHLP